MTENEEKKKKKMRKRVRTWPIMTYERHHQQLPNETSNVQEFLYTQSLKVGLSPSKKVCVIYFNESPLKMMNNAFYFILRALSVLKIFKFLS